MEGFKDLFSAFLDKTKNKPIEWDKIKPPSPGMIVHTKDIPACPEDRKQGLLSKLAVLKLNGGLGTTMGCTGPKSVIEVRNDKTFLDLTVIQLEHLNKTYNSKVPLVLMNSFNTHDDTIKIVRKYTDNLIYTFNQSQYPRIYKDTLIPMPDSVHGSKEAWYPPGHGDIFPALFNSGLLSKLLSEGREYIFVSNVDNLGATVDLNILNHVIETKCEYLMEVTDKSPADVKGGTLIDYEGRARLLEIAQVPASKIDEFKSIKKFKIFNTNNLWINLRAIERLIKEKSFDTMDIIVNPKVEGGKAILQLERAAGAAIQYFHHSHGINVPRSRFIPVKSCSDLLVVQSNLFSLNEGYLAVNPKRPYNTVPFVKLGDEFKRVGDFMKRFKGIPDILELDRLTVSGDVTFGEGIRMKGTVVIVANAGAHVDIPPFSILENKVIWGNLRILDH